MMTKEILNSIWYEAIYHEQIEHKRPVKIFVNDYLYSFIKSSCNYSFMLSAEDKNKIFGIEIQPYTNYKDEPEYYLSFEKGKFRKIYDEPIVFKPNTEAGE